MSDELEPLQSNEQVVAEPESDHAVELEPDHEPKVDPVPELGVELKPEREPEVDPVPEPKAEPVPTDSCQDVDIEPLSGKPYFPIVIVKSHIGLVAYKYQVALPNKTTPVILTRGGNSWETTYLGENAPSYKRFDSRWRAFAEDNNLKVGDVCVFELMEQSDTLLKFKVQVLRGDFPSMLLNKEDGTINNPIVVE